MDNEDLSHHYELLLLLSLSEASDRVLTLKKLIPIERFFLCLLIMGITFVKFSASVALITIVLVIFGLFALHFYRDSVQKDLVALYRKLVMTYENLRSDN